MIHQIGGQDDTNANTTRRILLLLESQVIGRRDAYDRVFSNILLRYLNEDRGLWYGSSSFKVPRFMLNDIARYWRTMAVDFAYKQRVRGNEGWALRNIKLRVSRKLIFISGLLACFSCHLQLSKEERELIYRTSAVHALVAHLQRTMSVPPLDLLADVLIQYKQLYEPANRLFAAYDEFIGLLADQTPSVEGRTPRVHLEELSLERLNTDALFSKARDVCHEFQEAVRDIFLRSDTELSQLTIEYGVF